MNLPVPLRHFFKVSTWSGLLLITVFGFCAYGHAGTVQRWQDKNGQWHFADASSSQGHKTQPVYIANPISIIHNDQLAQKPAPQEKMVAARQRKSATRQAVKSSSAKSSSGAKRLPADCAQRREQLYEQPYQTTAHPRRGSKAASRHQQQRDYEHDCIAGHYYGSASSP